MSARLRVVSLTVETPALTVMLKRPVCAEVFVAFLMVSHSSLAGACA